MAGSFARESHPMKSHRLAFLALAALAPWSSALRAADAIVSEFPPHVLRNTQLRALPRAANGGDYLLYVALPPDYATETKKRYPVLYICDGYWDFTLIDGFYGNLIYDRVAPHFIIVGFG